MPITTRNATRTGAAIDCEIDHPIYGWLPFTARDATGDHEVQAVWDALTSSGTPIPNAVDDPVRMLATERARMKCSRFQARAALHIAGLLSSADTAVAAAPVLTQIAWADAQEFQRASPTIAALAPALGLTEFDIDDLFRAAMQITA